MYKGRKLCFAVTITEGKAGAVADVAADVVDVVDVVAGAAANKHVYVSPEHLLDL